MEFAPNQLVFLSILFSWLLVCGYPCFLIIKTLRTLICFLYSKQKDSKNTRHLFFLESCDYSKLWNTLNITMEQNQGEGLGWPLEKKTQFLSLSPYTFLPSLFLLLFLFSILNCGKSLIWVYVSLKCDVIFSIYRGVCRVLLGVKI